ncbi:MAG: DUF1223 domain-containing protein [Pseudomonadota bacterium]
MQLTSSSHTAEKRFSQCGRYLRSAVFALVTLFGGVEAAQAGAKGVIELYTSQGCSSCPPADELAAELAKDPDLVVLTLPVTYWDYLGWKDTFAKEAFNERQYGYAALRGDRSVYTPQMVVNGDDHAVGSNARQVNRLLKRDKLPVDISVSLDGDDLAIEVERHRTSKSATLWAILYQKKGTVSIGRGENRNRTITYTNIVREMRPLAKWNGDAMTFKLPKEDAMGRKADGFALVLQTKQSGRPSRILGAAMLSSPSS